MQRVTVLASALRQDHAAVALPSDFAGNGQRFTRDLRSIVVRPGSRLPLPWRSSQRIAQIGARGFGVLLQLRDDCGVSRGDIGGFAPVVFQIVKFGAFDGAPLISHGFSVVAPGVLAEGEIGVGATATSSARRRW